MRGSPLIQCLVGALAFALFAIPLARLTIARPGVVVSSVPAPANAAEARHTIIRIRFAHPPQTLTLKLADRDLLPPLPSPVASPFEAEALLPFTKDNLELNLTAQWPEGTPETALTVELEPDELDSRAQTLWSAGAVLNSILTFQW